MLLNINNIHWKECFYTQMFNYYLQTYMLYFLYVYNCFTCSKYFHSILNSFISFVKRFCLCIFLERRMEGGRKGEKHQCVIASYVVVPGDLACNPGMCPNWELNWQPFGLQSMLNPLSYTSQGGRGIFKGAVQGGWVIHASWQMLE